MSVNWKLVGTPPTSVKFAVWPSGTSASVSYGCAAAQLKATRTLCTPLATIVLSWLGKLIGVSGPNMGPSTSTPTNPWGTGPGAVIFGLLVLGVPDLGAPVLGAPACRERAPACVARAAASARAATSSSSPVSRGRSANLLARSGMAAQCNQESSGAAQTSAEAHATAHQHEAQLAANQPS